MKGECPGATIAWLRPTSRSFVDLHDLGVPVAPDSLDPPSTYLGQRVSYRLMVSAVLTYAPSTRQRFEPVDDGHPLSSVCQRLRERSIRPIIMLVDQDIEADYQVSSQGFALNDLKKIARDEVPRRS